jgi:acetyl-CoA acetyltransferase
MGRRVFVVGVGMIKFEKPGKRDWDYPKMGAVAGKKALWDAGIRYDEIDQAVTHPPHFPQSSSFYIFL